MTEINLYKRGQGDVALSASEGQVGYTHCWADSWRTGGESGSWAQSHNVCFGVVSPGSGVY